jgi:hypothetical protein
MISITVRRLAISVLVALPACGGDNGSGPPPEPEVTLVEISPSPVTVFMGDTIQLTATVKDQNGAAMSGKKVGWASDAPAVATVDSAGRVIALTSGSAIISATVEAKTGSITLTSTGPGTTGAVTGSANVTPAGGSVQATLPGGGTLALTVPPSALRNTTTITLEPVVPPPGSLASFRITPAGVQFDRSATLVIKVSSGARLRSSSRLVIEQDGVKIPLSGTLDLNQGTMTVTLSSLGLATDPVSGFRATSHDNDALADSTGQATATVSNLHLDQLLAMAGALLNNLVRTGTPAAALAVEQPMVDLAREIPVTDPRFGSLATLWVTTVCQFTGNSFNELSSFGFVSDYQGLQRVITLAVLWERMRTQMNAVLQPLGAFTCPNPVDAQARVSTKLTSLAPAIVADLNAFAIEPPPREASFYNDRLRPLFAVSTMLELYGYDPQAQLLTDILAEQFRRIKAAGWVQCRRSPTSQNLHGIVGSATAAAPVPGVDQAEVQDDIERCGMLIDWALLDAAGVTVRRDTLGPPVGASPGQAILSDSATLVGSGQLSIGGFLQALLCAPPASQNNEQFEILAGPARGPNAGALTRVASVGSSNTNRYMEFSRLNISTDTLRRAGGLAPGDTGTANVVFRRAGGICSGSLGLIHHKILGTLALSFRNEIRFTFDSDLEGWSVTNSGTPDGTPPWAYTIWDSQSGKGVVNMDGRDTQLDSEPEATISKSIALPSGVTTMSFEVSAHNRPDSHVGYRVLVNGQILLNAVIVGPEPPAFRYVTRTVDISAFAGQTVTIQFQQHDNGSNGNFPGSSKHLYIDNIRIR